MDDKKLESLIKKRLVELVSEISDQFQRCELQLFIRFESKPTQFDTYGTMTPDTLAAICESQVLDYTEGKVKFNPKKVN